MQRDGFTHLVRGKNLGAALARVLKRSLTSKIERKPSHYEILGIEKDASVGDIKEAYVKLSKQYHPDRNVNDQSLHGVFIKVNEAYKTLSDKEQRKEYDSLHGFAPIQTARATSQNPFGANNYSTYADSWYDEKHQEDSTQHSRYSNRRHYQFVNTRYSEGRKPENVKFFVYLIAYTIIGSGFCFAIVQFWHRKYRAHVDRVSEENGKLYEGIVKQARDNGPWEQLNLFKEKALRQKDSAESKKR